MTLDACYQKYQGTSILVPGGGAGNNGQCAQWADTVLHEVYGLPYIYTPAAKDWWNKADALGLSQHFDKITDGSVKKGDFVVYNPINAADVQGHIDVAAQDGNRNSYVGYDSNWGGAAFYKNGYPILHTVTHADGYNKFIIGSLRLKGDDMPQPASEDLRYIMIRGILGREPTLAEMQNPDYAKNVELLGQTLWNNGGAARYKQTVSTTPSPILKPYDGPPLFTKQ